MDPVTAFSVATSALQLTELGLKAVKNVRQIYRNGHLDGDESTESVTTRLKAACDKLQADINTLPRAASGDDEDILSIANSCSTTANQLLEELSKRQASSSGGRRQAIRAGLRSLRSNDLDTIKKQLDQYLGILNTSLLVRLESRIARKEAAARKQREIDDLRESLYFPSIYKRREDISAPYYGTYQWIFGEIDEPLQSHRLASIDNDCSFLDNTLFVPDRYLLSARCKETRRELSEVKFTDWLGSDDSLYWITGKPGSGKSCLMKYICQNSNTSGIPRAAGDGLARSKMISHYFWKPGDPLQNTVLGMLCTLLYEILRIDAEALLVSARAVLGPGIDHWLQGIDRRERHSEEQLLAMLRQHLGAKETNARWLVLIDGLDECVEEEQERLLDIIRNLQRLNGVKVCVSSRAEQIFRFEFNGSQHLRLEALNYQDIVQTVVGKLLPALGQYQNSAELYGKAWFFSSLVDKIAERAEGIFLWVDLVLKDLKKGLKSQDTVEMLQSRLLAMPKSLEALYSHLLGQIDPLYHEEAYGIFRTLLPPNLPRKMTVMDFAFMDDSDQPWLSLLHEEDQYFASNSFSETLERIELRLKDCTAGLITVETPQINPVLTSEPLDVAMTVLNLNCHYNRSVTLIHRSVVEFLGERAYKPQCRANQETQAWYKYVRAELGSLALWSLHPGVVDLSGTRTRGVAVTLKNIIMALFRNTAWSADARASTSSLPELIDGSNLLDFKLTDEQLLYVDYTERILSKVQSTAVYKVPLVEEDLQPFHSTIYKTPLCDSIQDVIGVLAFYGIFEYVNYALSAKSCNTESRQYLLTSLMLGFSHPIRDQVYERGMMSMLQTLLSLVNHGADIVNTNCLVHLSSSWLSQLRWRVSYSCWAYAFDRCCSCLEYLRTDTLFELSMRALDALIMIGGPVNEKVYFMEYGPAVKTIGFRGPTVCISSKSPLARLKDVIRAQRLGRCKVLEEKRDALIACGAKEESLVEYLCFMTEVYTFDRMYSVPLAEGKCLNDLFRRKEDSQGDERELFQNRIYCSLSDLPSKLTDGDVVSLLEPRVLNPRGFIHVPEDKIADMIYRHPREMDDGDSDTESVRTAPESPLTADSPVLSFVDADWSYIAATTLNELSLLRIH